MRNEAIQLKRTQQTLWRFITAPEGVEKALLENPGTVLPIRGDARLSSAQRLDIYANMYYYRILDSLKEDFPAVLKSVGEARFHNLVTDYLIAHPSHHWSLRDVGGTLPGYLTNYPLARTRPFLSELAQFEWALLDSFDAADGAVLTRQHLSTIPAANWGELHFRLVPAFRMIKSVWPVEKIRDGKTKMVPKSSPQESYLIVWRRELKVYYRRVDSLESALLDKMRDGCRFADLCDLTAEFDTDQALARLYGFLGSWLDDDLLVDFLPPNTQP